MKKIINVSDQIKLDSEQRRSFVKLSAFAGVGAAASAFIPGAALASSVTEEKAEAKTQKGYQLTPHVIEYYKTAAS